MRGALIHGVLLAVMLVYGYRTWTRDKTVQPDHGAVVLWDKSPDDLVSAEYKTEKKDVKIERKPSADGGFWWGTDTTIDRKPKPKPAAGSNGSAEGSAGSAAGSGSAAQEFDETRKTREFPVGDAGDKLIVALTSARALRDLGPPSDDTKKEHKLTDSKTTLTITLKDGTHTFLVGGSPFGGGDRYVLDEASGREYVVSKDLITSLEVGENSLHLVDPRGFDATKVDQVTIEAGGKSVTVARIETGVEGQTVKTWGDPTTKKADQTIANFIDNANNLRPTEYQPAVQLASLTPIVKLSYRDAKGHPLGYIELFKHDKPAEPPPNATPATPPKPITEYFIMSEKTRVPALLRKETAERTEQDVPTVMGDHPLELPPKAPPTHGGPGFKPGSGPLPPVPASPAGKAATPAPATPGKTATPVPAPATPGKAATPAPATPAPGKAATPAPPAVVPGKAVTPAPAPSHP
jgi:hypothetical protein